MTLEDFEKSLSEGKKTRKHAETTESDDKGRKRSKHHHHQHHHHRHHHKSGEDEHRHKPSGHSRSHDADNAGYQPSNEKPEYGTYGPQVEEEDEWVEKHAATRSASVKKNRMQEPAVQSELKRDLWMESPSTLEFDYMQKGYRKPSEPTTSRSSKADFNLKIHENELNKHHLQALADGVDITDEVANEPAQRGVDYIFGDKGAQWRMTKLKAVFSQAHETGRPVDDIALERFGNLRAFDDAREEQLELDRRETYGEGYVGKEKPSEELFQQRKLDVGIRTQNSFSDRDSVSDRENLFRDIGERIPSTTTVQMDQTSLNRLKAQTLRAKLRGSSDATGLEAKYDDAMASLINRKEPEVVVLGAMENRMLASGRKGEVKAVDNKRGRERGLVEENEDMSIEDMVREERRTRNQAGGEGQRFAERIAKDCKFDNDLDYMDENASRLAKRVQKSEINLKNMAISDFQKMNRILDKCPLCYKEDTNSPPIAPIVSLATRVYLTLPTEPEISDGGACIIPVQHRGNLLECDDDEWEEIRNFMKSLTRMYHDQGRDVIFYENAAVPQRRKHAGMEVVPLPYSLGETAPAFFKEAILVSDEEWTQHKKLIDTLSKAKGGLGRLAFRRTLVKEMPYFHVWFEIDGGLGHIVEDTNRWPKGDLFAREIIGGILDREPDVIKRQGRWNSGGDRRIEGFRKRWRKFDWTRVLTGADALS